jgi:hypothetical protein
MKSIITVAVFGTPTDFPNAISISFVTLDATGEHTNEGHHGMSMCWDDLKRSFALDFYRQQDVKIALVAGRKVFLANKNFREMPSKAVEKLARMLPSTGS